MLKLLLFISLLLIFGVLVFLYLVFPSTRNQWVNRPNSNIEQISRSNPTNYPIYFINNDQLWMKGSNREDDKVVYKSTPIFDFLIDNDSHKIILLAKDGKVISLNPTDLSSATLFSFPNNYQQTVNWKIDQGILKFVLYDKNKNDYKPLICTYNKAFACESGDFTSGEQNYYLSTISKGGKKAKFVGGNLLVNNTEILKWQGYDYKLNPGCSRPKWLPDERRLIISCYPSIWIVDTNTKETATFTTGSYPQFFE